MTMVRNWPIASVAAFLVKGMNRSSMRALVSTVFLGAMVLAAAPSHAETIQHFWVDPNTEQWVIDRPQVNQSYVQHPQISFNPGDTFWIIAGGGYNRGGDGDTWVRFVNPLDPSGRGLYYGMVEIPGITPGMIHIADINRLTITIPKETSPYGLYLRLGVLDQPGAYGDNGYYDRDPGWRNQCVGEPDAYVVVTIQHPDEEAVMRAAASASWWAAVAASP
jgi:hypothetical protein